MISKRIRELRDKAGFSQADLARKLDVTHSSVNAWKMGLSTPATQYIVEMCKLFHVSADYILGLDTAMYLSFQGYSSDEVELVYSLIKYIDSRK